MLSFARVLSVSHDSQKVTLASVYSSACVNCPSIKVCRRSSKTFTALNINGFDLKEGNIVKIAQKTPVRVLQGICALFFPITVCALALVFSPKIFTALNLPSTIHFSETIRFLTGFLGFMLAEAAVFAFSRGDFIPLAPIIKQKI